ncbi:MAG: hypothetical protein LKF81_10185 [Prevotella sp.]|jgi:hypothetical protein|nr:hypothetical protein [Prevotella sp.]
MTANDYISQKFQSFGISLPEAELLDIQLSSGESADADVSKSNLTPINVAIVRYIPTLLLRYNSHSVSENGFSRSMSWDTQGIRDYYSMACKQYGLKDELNQKARISFL